MSNPHNDPGHGDSPAAWTAVAIMLLAFTAGGLFFFLEMPLYVYISAAVFVCGPIVGWIMAKAGYGVKGPKFTPKKH